MKRSEVRETAFKAIYTKLYNTTDEALSSIEDNVQDEKGLKFMNDILTCYDQNRDEINNLISAKLKGYVLSRVFKIDLAIITLAVIEINFIKETPKQVVINEAVELAKKYSTKRSPKFVNGVLADIVE